MQPLESKWRSLVEFSVGLEVVDLVRICQGAAKLVGLVSQKTELKCGLLFVEGEVSDLLLVDDELDHLSVDGAIEHKVLHED